VGDGQAVVHQGAGSGPEAQPHYHPAIPDLVNKVGPQDKGLGPALLAEGVHLGFYPAHYGGGKVLVAPGSAFINELA